MSSCILTAGPASGDTPSQALGRLCLLPRADAILHSKNTDVASVHRQAGDIQHNFSTLLFIYTGILKVEKQPRNPTDIWLVFHLRIPLCHRNTIAMKLQQMQWTQYTGMED